MWLNSLTELAQPSRLAADRARIGITIGSYWGDIVQAIDVIATISALGAIGGLPVLLNALTKYTRFAMRWLLGWQSRAAATSPIHTLCSKE